MKFKSEHENPLPDLVELKTQVSAKEGEEDTQNVLVELRVHPHEIEETFGVISVGISEAILSMEFNGLEVVPRSKLGDPVVPTRTRQEVVHESSVTHSSDVSRTKSGGGKLAASATSLDGSAEYNRGTSEQSGKIVTEQSTRTEVIEHQHVKAIGHDNWKISAGQDTKLDGVYINHDTLCEVTPVAGMNRVGVEAAFVVRQRHLKAELVGDQSWWPSLPSTNQKRIAQVLIAKSLHESASGEPFDGKFIFANSQSFDEG